MKKKGILILVIVICAVAAGLFTFSVSYAFLNSTSKKENKFTVAENKIAIEENYEAPSELAPGTKITKEVKVKNTGNSEVYIRAIVVFSDDVAEKYSTLDNLDTTNWIKNGDYYYYKTAVDANNSTSNLFDSVTIKSETKEQDIHSFDITVYAESVDAKDQATYEDAWGLS